jgi:CheY-like chemotaxis protein
VRVLVADDMPIVRRLCASILRSAGHEAFEAENGRQALDQYLAERHDAILLDLRMPELDGVAVLRELGQMDPRPYVVVITAGTDADIREAIGQGARTIVLKPFSREHVLGALSRVVAHRHPPAGGMPLKIYSWTGRVDPSLYLAAGDGAVAS